MTAIHDLILREKGLVQILPAMGALTAYGAAGLLIGMRLHRLER